MRAPCVSESEPVLDIKPRSQGGSHHPSNITSRCFACHANIHRGTLEITGTAPDQLVTRRVAAPEPTTLDGAVVVTQARDALVGLGWKPAIARAAVDEARAHAGVASCEALIREALRRCPLPRR